MNDIIQQLTVYAIPVIFAITLHEAAHGYIARHFGDNTAYAQGRVTLNPLKHIDPIGTNVLPIVLQGRFIIGYAKPVPVVFGNLRKPKRDMIWVALAGPAANLIQSILWLVGGLIATKFGVREPFVIEVVKAGFGVNLAIMAFNLFPLPPLDGGRVMQGVLPTRASLAYSRVEPYGFFIVMGLVAVGALNIWMQPVMNVFQSLIFFLISPFF